MRGFSMDVEVLDTHRTLFDIILSRAADNLEELSVEIEEGWRLPPIDLPVLKDLQLQRAELSGPPSLTYPKGERGLNAAPMLERLWLENWNLSDVAHHDFIDLVSHIRRLSIRPDAEGYGMPENNIAILAKELPRLTGFDCFDPHLGRASVPEVELLTHLLIRKDDLTQLYIETDSFYIDFTLLSCFENLKHLRLHCFIQVDLDAEAENEDEDEMVSILKAHPLPLPHSLETLWIFIVGKLHVWILVQLSQSLNQYVNLKYVRCISSTILEDQGFWDKAWRILNEEGVGKSFAKANVEFEVARIDHERSERTRTLVNYVAYDEDWNYWDEV
ncbi:hypothetical protein G7Z17_g8959 [Cylindrodendrum hubeiense]|uniref:Uncharacterized protein n=1 Tax=Cylindrodendrum hubeiense TaxID=595255 RepID=A0A9P5LE63_9HYPO|nr:hypothetical protein G7Z17_g8959 [Cylindrodendrum hubeiense]